MIPHADAKLIAHHESDEVDFMICSLDEHCIVFDVQIESVGMCLRYKCIRKDKSTVEEYIELIAKAGKQQIITAVMAEREIMMKREGVAYVRN